MQVYVYLRVVVLNLIVRWDLGVFFDLESVKYAKKMVKSALYHSMMKNVVVVSVISHPTLLMVLGCVKILLNLIGFKAPLVLRINLKKVKCA
jgi:signal transduction histidine kinase